ncbi:unnamed protein product [Cladocopium goreaui]|uniref:Mechanosensitive ion channel MscS domain-containing protein n=1 Tax=Cladocopium goreaui TaxID=2562237 RepID=A0A9P1CNG3_9DINO|nr:unnamed protein product [Cladocopium goreaui]
MAVALVSPLMIEATLRHAVVNLCVEFPASAVPRVLTKDELTSVQEALGDDLVFQSSVDLEDVKISEGMKVLNSRKAIQEAKMPLTLRFYQPMRRPAWLKSHWWRSLDLARAILLRAQGPILLWGWSTLTLTFMASLVSPMWSRKEFAMYRSCLEKLVVVPSWTAVAWFLHRLVRLWGQRVSRGRAELSDVMGMQSSLREARINALQTSMKVLLWASYLFALLWHGGIQLSQLLLIPGTTAVVIGWVGREIVCNMISGVVLHLTQPFAQGDWISLTDEDIDGWVQDVGSFYTKVVQWDKRPIYVPNGKLMSLNVQNNSRMTHRRIKYELKLRLQDIPKISTIVRDIQEMLAEHEDIDNVQHQLVRWRGVGEYSADIWLSCYTKPTIEGIRLKTYTATQQSVLERCSQIVYKHEAAFASSTDRIQYPGGGTGGSKGAMSIGQLFQDTFNGARESQLESREQVLRQREKDIKELERELEQKGEEQAKAEKEIQAAREKLQLEMQKVEKQKALQEAAAAEEAAVAELQNEEVQQAQAQAQAESAPWPTPGPDIVRRCVTGHNGEEPWRGLSGRLKMLLKSKSLESVRRSRSLLKKMSNTRCHTQEKMWHQSGRKEANTAMSKVARPMLGPVAADMESELKATTSKAKDKESKNNKNKNNVERLSQEQKSEVLAAVKNGEDEDEAEMLRIPVKEMGD